jgi:phthalate 4,5-cis-dihydrodiol dehydrogenase
MRVGVAGLGVASTNALPEIAAHPRVRLTAAADLRPEARDAFTRQFGARAYESVEALCESPDVDAVYVLTPNRWHARHAILAAEAGKQVIADKPMALTLSDCDAMLAAAEHHGVRLLVGHSQGLDGPIVKMANLIVSGELGKLLTVNTWFFSDWLYRPRGQEEFESPEEGLVLRQGPPQVDIVRMLGGGLVQTVRAATSRAAPTRPCDGSYTAYLEFADGVPATLVYSAYAHFDSSELTFGLGLAGVPVPPDGFARARQQVAGFARCEDEWAYKESTRYGGPRAGTGVAPPERRHAFFGLTVASCERGDVRQSPGGLTVYGDEGRREVPLPLDSPLGQRYTSMELDLMYAAWANDAPLAAYDGHWGKATLEVCLAIQRAAAERREVSLSHQAPYRMIPIE